MPLCNDDILKHVTEAIAQLVAFINGDWDLPNGGLEAFERAVRDQLNSVGQAAMRDAFAQFDPGQKRLLDGRVRVTDSERRYMSSFGPVAVWRGL